MKPAIISTHRVVETTSDIRYVLLGDVVVYQRTTTTRTVGKEPTISISEGTTSKEGLAAFEQGAVSLPHSSKQAAIVANSGVREALRTFGWAEFTHAAIRQILTDPYTRIMSGDASEKDILILNGQEKVTDVQGRPVPIAVHFDYINGHMDDSRYDLSKALTILKARSDVRFPPDDGRDGRTGTVLSIPHYNTEGHRNHFLRFVWMPSDVDYQQLHEVLPKEAQMFEPHRTIFDHDLLGLRSGGAALYNDFYKHRE